jgi:hypothetical protein
MTLSVRDGLEIEFEKRREHYYEDLSWTLDEEEDLIELDLHGEGE